METRISFVRQRLRCHILGDPSENGSVDDAKEQLTYFLKQFLNGVVSHLNLGRPPQRLLQETSSPRHMTTITFIDGKQVDESDGERDGTKGYWGRTTFWYFCLEPRLPRKLGFGPLPATACCRRLIVARCLSLCVLPSIEGGMDNIRVILRGFFRLVDW